MFTLKDQSRIKLMFSDIQFNSRRHLYFLNGEKLPSVSSLVSSFSPVFNTEAMLPFSAKKQGTTVHELRHKWQTINQTACDLGHKVHKFMENFTGIETPSCPQEEAGIKYIKSLEGQYRVFFREFRAYSKEFKYAGTMDLPLEVVNEDTYIIDDYKTSGDLFKAYNMLKPPFEYLEASAFSKYQIQLSLYQIMLEEVGLKINNRRLVHLKADSEFRIFDLISLVDELKDYMKAKKN